MSQVLIAAALALLSTIDPAQAITAFAFVALAVAISSATQDMAIDAYRIECAPDEMQGLMAASYQYGYRIAIIVGGAGALYIADFMSWTIAYQAMAVCMGIGMLTTLLAKEPPVPEGVNVDERIFEDGFGRWFLNSVAGPFADFFKRYGWFALTMLLFIALYRISDYVLGILANPFYDDIGFTKSQVASVAKLYGLWVALLGIAGGGVAIAKLGPARSLILSATLIAVTNLFFLFLAKAGPDLLALTITISFDNFAQGFSGTVFIAYLSSLTNVSFTATQYALFSSLSVFVGKLVAGADPLKPQVEVYVDDVAGPDVAQKVQRRLQHFIDRKIAALFEPLLNLSRDETLTGLARGFAFQMVEGLGVLPRAQVANEVKALDQEARGSLRKHGIRFGQFTIFLPLLLKHRC